MIDFDARKLACTLTLGLFLFYLAFLRPGIYSIDGNSMLAVAESIVTHHDFTVPPGGALGMEGRDGRLYSPWYPLQSILSLPFVAAALPLAGILRAPFHVLSTAFVSVLPPIFTALTAGFVLLIALQLGSSTRGARRAVLCFGLGTIALPYTRTFYAEPLLGLLITGAIYFTFEESPKTIVLAAAFAALAVLAKPTGIFLGPALSLYLLLRRASFRISVLPAIGASLGLALYCAYNVIRFGHPLIFGHPYTFSISEFPEGFLGLLLSPGRGLVWFSPAVFLGFWGAWRIASARRLQVLLIVGLFVFFLVLHSFWIYWDGGWSWGPRFLVPVIPIVMALTGVLEGKAARALILLSMIGFVVSAPTLLADYERNYEEAYARKASESDQRWSPSQAPALRMWGASGRVLGELHRNNPNQPVAIWWEIPPIFCIPVWLGTACSLAIILLASRIMRPALHLKTAPG